MKPLIKRIINSVTGQSVEEQRAKLFSNLMRHEAKIGGEIFGEVSKNRRREFFCLDEHSWVWHEEWTNQDGQQQIVTTRYDVRPDGILKSQNGSHYQRVLPGEASRLAKAAEMYTERIKKEVYSFA